MMDRERAAPSVRRTPLPGHCCKRAAGPHVNSCFAHLPAYRGPARNTAVFILENTIYCNGSVTHEKENRAPESSINKRGNRTPG
jgi:hypothetical protein